jgi:hypothetical protein
LIETHEIRRKLKAGLRGPRRGREAAALDASGAVRGALGLLAFAAAFFLLVETSVTVAFVSASLAWLFVSVTAWYAWRRTRACPEHQNAEAWPLSGSLKSSSFTLYAVVIGNNY